MTRNNLMIIGGVAGALVVGFAVGRGTAPRAGDPVAVAASGSGSSVAVASASSSAAPIEPPAPTYAWHYRTSNDEMTSKPVRFASVTSDTALDLNAPYDGTQYPVLTVRSHPTHGLDAFVTVDEGQMLCHDSYSDPCVISVRFDDAPAVKMAANESADNSSNIVFFANGREFFRRAAAAKRVLVQVPFYQNGNKVFEFKTEGFDAEQAMMSPKPKAK